MDPLVKINIGAAPNDGTGEPARDAFAKHNKNMDSIANALGAASGIATLGADGRLPAGQAPIEYAVVLPTTTHDLNAYVTPGVFYQAAISGATAPTGVNYPTAQVGFLEVVATGTPVLQVYTTRNATLAIQQRFWRVRVSSTNWSAWKEIADNTVAFTFQGSMASSPAQDLNTYTQRGQWAVGSSAIAAAGSNFPIAQSGQLLVYSGGYPGGPTATGVSQVYLAANSNRTFFRALVSGTWSAWEEAVRSSLLGASQGVGTLDTSGRAPVTQYPYSAVVAAGTDANTLSLPGLYYVNSDAQATAALNWPQQLAGTLEVEAAAGGNSQVTQTYTTRNGTGGVLRRYVRARFGTGGGTWGVWFEMGRYDHGQCRFNYVSATECRLVPFNGNGLIINGRQYRIPAGGVALSNSGLAANTNYYVFARDDGTGGIALEARTGVSHVTHTDGVEILSGDAGRTLVGHIRTTASSQFAHSTTYRWVASWFNRTRFALLEGPTNSATSSTSYVQLTSGFSALIWARDLVSLTATGVAWSTSANGGGYWIIAANGTGIAGGYGNNFPVAGALYSTAIASVYSPATDAAVSFAPFGQTSLASNPVAFKQDFAAQVLQ